MFALFRNLSIHPKNSEKTWLTAALELAETDVNCLMLLLARRFEVHDANRRRERPDLVFRVRLEPELDAMR